MPTQSTVAFITEPDCIGCALCLKVCPTDAILGAAQFMHTVIADDCTGCKRCVPVCPTDCISMVPRPAEATAPAAMASRWRRLVRARRRRLAGEVAAQDAARRARKAALRGPPR